MSQTYIWSMWAIWCQHQSKTIRLFCPWALLRPESPVSWATAANVCSCCDEGGRRRSWPSEGWDVYANSKWNILNNYPNESRNSTTFVSFSKEVFYQIFKHSRQSETLVWVKWSWLDVPDISQIKFMAQLLLQSAQLFSPGKTSVVSLCCLWFVVPQPRANKIKTLYI